MSIFTASGPSPLFFDMKRLNCLPVILALISTTSVAEQDLPTYKSIPIWPEDGIIPEEWQDRYVFLDLDAGQMVLAYPTRLARGDARHYPEPFRIERFDLNNQVDASISASVRRGSDSNFIYEYEVSNSSEAKQAISTLRIPTRKFGPDDAILAPASWRGVASPSSINAIRLSVGTPTGVFLVWYEFDLNSNSSQFHPGTTMKGFKVKSQLMPGLTVAYASGGGDPDPRRGDMPEAVLSQSDPIIQIEFNSQNILTVGPKFGPESSKALILEDFRRGIDLHVDSGQTELDFPSVRHALEVVQQCLAGGDENSSGDLRSCDLDFAFSLNPTPGLESDVLNAMRLSLAE